MPTVVAQPYSTAGNGGRKLVRLNNGWLFAVTVQSDNSIIYVSKDNGNTWALFKTNQWASVQDACLATNGENIYLLFAKQNADVRILRFTKEGVMIGGNDVSIDSSQASLGKISLAIDPTNGHLHAAWASKNATYPNSFNIRYAKSTDGGATWSAVEYVTAYNNTASYQYTNPSIVIVNGMPILLYQALDNATYRIYAKMRTNGNWNSNADGKTVYSGGSYVQSNPSAVVDKDGVIADVWHGTDATHTTTDYIRFSKSPDGGVTWSAMKKLVPGKNGTLTVDKNNKYVITYEDGGVIKRIDSSDKGDNWSVPTTVGNGTNPSSMYDSTFAGQFGTASPTIYQTASSVEYIGSYLTNSAPVINVTSPTANQTLHENDVFNITGTTSDTDVGNSVTVRYQLNAEPARAIKAFISTGATEAFSKSLTFKAGKLFDGETAVTGVLADGVAHKLTVYATDDQGGTSPVVERTFYAVPNRAPALTVDAVTPSGIINTDAFDISGSYSDPDGNTTTVRYKINGSNPVEIANGTSGAWSFTLPLGKLVVGENTIVIEAEDTYGAKTSKTVKLRKNEVKTSIKTGVARYKIEPPTGTAQEVMLWIQHDANLTLDTSISMTQAAEAETYVPMSLTNTASLSNGQVESEFYYNASVAKENIIVQITQTKTAADANEKITLISGVL